MKHGIRLERDAQGAFLVIPPVRVDATFDGVRVYLTPSELAALLRSLTPSDKG